MTTERLDAVVVGAGQGGLAVSHYLKLFGIDHAVLERGRVGESWRSARWNSFTLVTPAWMTRLPGIEPNLPAEVFATRAQTVRLLEDFAQGLPVRVGVDVQKLETDPRGGYLVHTSRGDIRARTVVVASGGLRIPVLARPLPATVDQLHSAAYLSPDQLRDGGVVVVGSGQSGAQIAEELASGRRRVFLATSRVPRVPRRYRGRDAHDWLVELGQADRAIGDMPDPEQRRVAQPMLSGGRGGHTVALQQLARDEVELLGRLESFDGESLVFDASLRENISFADRTADEFRNAVDAHVDSLGLAAPLPEPDVAEHPQPGLRSERRELKLADEHIATVIWATGLGPDTDWLAVPVLDANGNPLQNGGVTSAKGMYAVGFPWLTHGGSGVLYGVAADALRVARHLNATVRAETTKPAPKPLEPRPAD